MPGTEPVKSHIRTRSLDLIHFYYEGKALCGSKDGKYTVDPGEVTCPECEIELLQ